MICGTRWLSIAPVIRMKASFEGACRRCRPRARPPPSSRAPTTWSGAQRNRPTTSGTSTKEKVCVTVENSRGKRTELQGRYAIVTSPATLTAEILFSPALPEAQRDAFAQLRYGRATKTLLQLDRHPWRREKRPRACATDIELGAIWDGSEEQRGRAPL